MGRQQTSPKVRTATPPRSQRDVGDDQLDPERQRSTRDSARGPGSKDRSNARDEAWVARRWALGGSYSLVSALILVISLIVTTLGAYLAKDEVESDNMAAFEDGSAQAMSALQDRVFVLEETLLGLTNLFATSSSVSRDAFHESVLEGRSTERFSGVQALEFIRRVAAEDVATFEDAVRADRSVNGVGYPDFAVHPETDAVEHFVIDYVEPMAGNEGALGFDVTNNPAVVPALEQANRSGDPVATAPIRLVQETGNQIGFVVYAPVYADNMAQSTDAEQQAALEGFVAAVFRADDLLSDAFPAELAVELEIYDLGSVTDEPTLMPTVGGLLFDSNDQLEALDHGSLAGEPGVFEVEVSQRRWLLFMTPAHPVTAATAPIVLIVAFGGLALSLTLYGFLRMISRAKDTAETGARVLEHLATHDGLTGIANRAHLTNRIDQSLARTARDGGLVAVLFLDLDRFKIINDTSGHDVGDELLVAVAERLNAAVREGDTIARHGGDEFAVLAEDIIDVEQALGLAERILDAIRTPMTMHGTQIYPTASIGIAVATDGDHETATLLSNADAAMYQAKNGGRDRIELFDRSLMNRLRHQHRTENELREAIDGDQLRVHYQPIIEASSGLVRGTEALVRWQHPERGLLAPNEFIAIAEETGLIIAIDQWVLRTACRQTISWDTTPGTRLGINFNVSARHLVDPALPGHIEEIIESTGIEPNRLCVEVTETAIISHPSRAGASLTHLRRLGINIALDDFGTGYSSMTHLQDLPLTHIKIDRRFTAGVGTRSKDTAIIRSTIGLAHDLGLAVVAEGVETPEQLAFLQANGCDFAQGFHISRPQPADELEHHLQPGHRLATPPEK